MEILKDFRINRSAPYPANRLAKGTRVHNFPPATEQLEGLGAIINVTVNKKD